MGCHQGERAPRCVAYPLLQASGLADENDSAHRRTTLPFVYCELESSASLFSTVSNSRPADCAQVSFSMSDVLSATVIMTEPAGSGLDPEPSAAGTVPPWTRVTSTLFMICLVMLSPSIVTDPMPGMLIGWGADGLTVRTTTMVWPAVRMPPRTCSGLTTRLICSMPFGTATASSAARAGSTKRLVSSCLLYTSPS